MRISVDLPSEIVWALMEEAESRSIPTGDVAAEKLLARIDPPSFESRIRARVMMAKMCDADIARELNVTTRVVSTKRRAMGLAANPRTWEVAPKAKSPEPPAFGARAICFACHWIGPVRTYVGVVERDMTKHQGSCPDREEKAA